MGHASSMVDCLHEWRAPCYSQLGIQCFSCFSSSMWSSVCSYYFDELLRHLLRIVLLGPYLVLCEGFILYLPSDGFLFSFQVGRLLGFIFFLLHLILLDHLYKLPIFYYLWIINTCNSPFEKKKLKFVEHSNLGFQASKVLWSLIFIFY